MVSFKEFRELLIVLYADNAISDAEFVLLYNSFSSRNPDFPYDSYELFKLDSMNSAECKGEFRVEKQDLPRLVQALQLPPVFKCEQRSICDDMEGMLLKRVAYPSYVVDENTLSVLKVNTSSLKLIFEPLRTWYMLVSNTKNRKINQDGLRKHKKCRLYENKH